VFRDPRGKGIKGYVKEGVSQVLQSNCNRQTQPKKRRKELPRVPRSRPHRIYLPSTLPRAAHSASNTPRVGKGNGVDITGWLVSPGVRSIYAEDGAVLLDIQKGLRDSLNVVGGTRVANNRSESNGNYFEGIVGAIETHFNVPRHQLETDTVEYLEKLERMGLIQYNGRGMSSKAFGGGR